jgi:hypothetical protein
MATEEFGTVTFENGKPIPVDEFDTYEFPDESKKDTQKEPEIDIEVIDDTPAVDKGRKPMDESVEEVTDDELEAYDVKVQKRIKKLGRGYHDERRAKEEAIRMREEAIKVAQLAIDENRRLQSQLHEGSKIFIDQGKNNAETDLAMAKKAFKDAYDSGDSDALVEAQQKISEATLKLDKAFNLRPIEVQEPNYQVPRAQEPQQDEKLTTWVDENPWYGGEKPEEEEMTSLALTVHNRLAREFGEKYVGTDEYYQKISATIQKRFPDYFGSQEELETKPTKTKPQSRAKPAANVVAPATRSVAPQKVQLTTTQVQIAKRLGVPLELYARKVAEQMNGDK